MVLLKSTQNRIPPSELTVPRDFERRRSLCKLLMTAALAESPLMTALANTGAKPPTQARIEGSGDALDPTPRSLVRNYINYYELAIDKVTPVDLAKQITIDPWSIEVTGQVEHPVTFRLEDLLTKQSLRERIYRHRCVEGWSMVVPWFGFPLQDLLTAVKPLAAAKFVKFTSVFQPEAMPSQRTRSLLAWPYVEALRIDEAVHPLTLIATGMYGEPLTKQNGAPLRLVVPWKYGFKSIKAITKIELVVHPPSTSWNSAAPGEYGFYANVNPSVPHPRWSQVSERLLGSRFFTARRETELFNGYAEQVGALYQGMDLRRFF
jgi:methionine sulfoxide reductase catalytic subunit